MYWGDLLFEGVSGYEVARLGAGVIVLLLSFRVYLRSVTGAVGLVAGGARLFSPTLEGGVLL